MQNKLKSVAEFHKAFRLNVRQNPTTDLSDALITLRFKLMEEENSEYLQAARDKNLTEVADALGDMLYILCGTIIEHGLQHKIEEVFNEIHRRNMSKLDENGKPIYREDGKVMKGANYFSPDIQKIINE